MCAWSDDYESMKQLIYLGVIMNYIQILADLQDKLSRYNARLDMMNNSERTFADRDWFITIDKISKMEKLFPKVGKRVAQQFI